ncbi:MAG: AAA family ATPase [Nannocystaceae bacterium]|nr:AAA family ATPase [Myxococcales bacterium]
MAAAPTIPGYLVRERLAESASSVVHRATRQADGASVCVKIHRDEFPGPRELARYEHEFAIGRELQLGGVVRYWALEPYRRGYALVTEDFGAVDLQQVARMGFDLRRFLDVARGLAAALAGLHEQEIVHKDVKSANVVVRLDDVTVKLIDLGLATRVRRDLRAGARPQELGSLAYVSPEQTGRIGRSVDQRSDLYSAGVTLYELAVGRLPFATTDPLELTHCHIARAPRAAHELQPRLPEAVSAIIHKLLAKAAEERYQTASGLLVDLDRCRAALGRRGDIPAFELGADDRSDRLQISERLFGRADPLATQRRAFDAVRGGASRLLLVSGEPGLGKSALVQELRVPLVEHGGLFAAAKFDPLRNDRPYRALSEALGGLIRQTLSLPEERLASYRAAVNAALGAGVATLAALVPELALLCGPTPPVPAGEVHDAGARLRLLVQGLLRALTCERRVVALALDDLHWADLASLDLVLALVGDAEEAVPRVLVIATYRSGEGDLSPAAIAALRRIEAPHPSIVRVHLEPLTRADVRAWFGETLGREPDAVAALADLAHARTLGNPFFLSQWLTALRDVGGLAFVRGRQRWEWDLGAAQRLAAADNVLELLARAIAGLAEPVQAIVRTAAALGARFDLSTLATVRQRSAEDVARDLEEAVRAGLLVLAAEDDSYQFIHDRVQQAAYAAIAAPERHALHRSIARLLLARDDDALVFSIVAHYHQGGPLAAEERRELAALELRAGRRARASSAYTAAHAHFTAGLALLGEPPDDPALALAFHAELAEASVALADYEQLTTHVDAVLRGTDDLFEQTAVRMLRLQALQAQNRLGEAIDEAWEILRSLGVSLPRRPGRLRVVLAALWISVRLSRRSAAELAALPPMTDARELAIVRVLGRVLPLLYQSAPALLAIVVAELARRSLAGAVAPLAPYALASCGIVALAGLRNIAAGNRLARLASEVVGRVPVVEREAAYIGARHLFLGPWSAPYRASLAPALRGLQVATAAGDLSTAALNAVGYCYFLFLASEPLERVEAEIAVHEASIRAMRQERFRGDLGRLRQIIANLRGEATVAPPVDGDHFDEQTETARWLAAGDRTAVGSLHVLKGMYFLLFGDAATALASLRAAAPFEPTLRGSFYSTLLCFYEALAVLIAAPREAGLAASALPRLQAWAKHAPENHAHRVALITAELARVRDDPIAAMAAYDRAITLAGEHGLVHEEALACERAADYYAARDLRRVARAYRADAIRAYRHWGADAKVAQLQSLEPDLALAEPRAPTLETSPSVSSSSLIALDASAVTRAAQAISSEILPAALVERLLRIVLASAGARRGALVFVRDGALFVEAQATLDEHRAFAPRALRLDDAADIAVGVVHFVHRTLEPVVLGNAAREGPFVDDPHVRASGARSVLCVPLMHRKDQLAGLLYLENELTTDAFTESRVELLRMLSAQAAISLTNARLYEELQQALARQTRLAEAHLRFVPREFLHSLHRGGIDEVELGDSAEKDMSILFADIVGFATMLEGLSSAAAIELLNEYLSYMEPAILEHGGFVDNYIGDAIVALFDEEADRAVLAALAMLRALKRLNARRRAAGTSALRMGIGLNTGRLTMGTIGGPSRLKCSVLGDSVNLAARVESLTRTYGVPLLISHHVHARLADPGRYCLRPVDRVQVVGKAEVVDLYEVFDADPPELCARKQAMLPIFSKALERYRARAFADADELLRGCEELVPGDTVVAVYRERCRALQAEAPGPAWTPVTRLLHK